MFGVASPLNTDSFFFGKDRTYVITELYGKYQQGEHGGLFGLRRIGKTSILNKLQQRVEQDNGAVKVLEMTFLSQKTAWIWKYSEKHSSIHVSGVLWRC